MATILVVDDDDTVRTLVAMTLGLEHIVIEAKNGKEGLELYLLHRPDIVITDMGMPIMNGIDLIKNIRATDRSTTIIVHSASIQDPVRKEEIINLSVDLCFLKPMGIPLLEESVNRLLTIPKRSKK